MPIDALTPYANVEDVGRSVEFYRHLGLEVQSSHESDGKLVWALVARPGDTANLVLRSRAVTIAHAACA